MRRKGAEAALGVLRGLSDGGGAWLRNVVNAGFVNDEAAAARSAAPA